METVPESVQAGHHIKKEGNITKRKSLLYFFVFALIVAYFVFSTLFISKSVFVQSALRHMDATERSAFENAMGQLEVERVTKKSEQMASTTGWQKFNLFLTHLNGGHVIEVSVPSIDPRYGTAYKTMYFNPNTFVFIGYGYRQ